MGCGWFCVLVCGAGTLWACFVHGDGFSCVFACFGLLWVFFLIAVSCILVFCFVVYVCVDFLEYFVVYRAWVGTEFWRSFCVVYFGLGGACVVGFVLDGLFVDILDCCLGMRPLDVLT